MRAVIVFVFCVFSWTEAQDINAMMNMPKYDARYDYLDVDAIFTNKRLVRNYVDCLINAHRCTPEGKALKRILPEALRTKCARCTERQKRTAVKVIKRLKYEYPEEWSKVSSRWDPTGDFTRYFEEFLAKEHFNTIPGSGPTINPIPVSPQSPPQPFPIPPVPQVPAVPSSAAPEMPLSIVPLSSPPRPIVLNRFGDDGELMVSSSSSGTATPLPTAAPTTTMRTTTRATTQPRPTPTMWSGGLPNAFPTRFPVRPSGTDVPQPYSTAITLIDQIGYKIIRTTELVTDLLRNTVRAVVGR